MQVYALTRVHRREYYAFIFCLWDETKKAVPVSGERDWLYKDKKDDFLFC